MDLLHPPGWNIGVEFRFTANPDGTRGRLAHRVYDGPPDGHRRRHTPPTDLDVDFTQNFTIVAIFVSRKWLAVQFAVRERLVWTNDRKHAAWWAEIVP